MAREQGTAMIAGKSSEAIYKIDVPANRYDLLCAEGLTRALMIFQKKHVSASIKSIIYLFLPKRYLFFSPQAYNTGISENFADAAHSDEGS